MCPRPLDRREFIRRATLTAGGIGAAGLAGSIPGCGSDNPTEPGPPPAPAGLTATPVSPTRIDLAWSDESGDETAFEVERRSGTEAEFSLLVTLAAGATTHADGTATERTLYFYRVRAMAGELGSDYSNVASATTPAAGTPLTPTGLAVTAVSADGATLSWNDVSTNEAEYRVDRRSGDSITPLATAPAGSTGITLAGLAADELHLVRVVAVNEIGDSAPSGEVRFFTGPVAANLALTPQEPGRQRIAWSDRTSGQLGFRVERRAGGDFETIATRPAGEILFSFDDTTFPTGDTVTWRVMADGAASVEGETAASDVPASAPSAAASLAAVLSPDDGSRVRLAWEHPGDPTLGGFQVERKIGTAAFVSIRLAGDPAERSFEDAPGSTFVLTQYRVRGWNLAGYSPFTGEPGVTPRAVFPLTGNLAVLNTVNKGAVVQIQRPSASVGSICNNSRTFLWLIRDSETHVAAVVAHCTHQCLTPFNFNWNESQLRFQCAHGSQFNTAGMVLQGPAALPVPVLATQLFADRVEILPPGSAAS